MGGTAEAREAEPRELIDRAGPGVMSNGARCGVEGATTGRFLPGMLAVGGGAYPVRPPLPMPGLCCAGFGLVLEAFLGDVPDFGEGAPPYFSNSCCVELYFVAAFNLSIVPSLSVCSSSKYVCRLDVR